MFDQAVIDRLRACFVDVFLRHPEVKCLAATVTWNGELNDADVRHALWLGPDGAVTKLDAVFTSVEQTLKLLAVQAARADELITKMRDTVRVLAGEVTTKREELEALNRQVRALEESRRRGIDPRADTPC